MSAATKTERMLEDTTKVGWSSLRTRMFRFPDVKPGSRLEYVWRIRHNRESRHRVVREQARDGDQQGRELKSVTLHRASPCRGNARPDADVTDPAVDHAPPPPVNRARTPRTDT